MRIDNLGPDWSIILETGNEAAALLAAQETPAGNAAMFTTDLRVDRVTPAISAIERLRFAQLTLDAEKPGEDTVVFPTGESQHLASLAYEAVRLARDSGQPLTPYDALLAAMDEQIDEHFGEGA